MIFKEEFLNVLGLDIGGANIKAADADGTSVSIAFPLWKQKDDLVAALMAATKAFESADIIALTMTGELADCFTTKSEGVRHIIQSTQAAFPTTPIRVWMTSGEFAEPTDALELPELVAAANWHALASWIGCALPEQPAVLIDMGSTTTDIIPILNGIPVPQGMNDRDRLLFGELVYTGARRTPVCAIVKSVLLESERPDNPPQSAASTRSAEGRQCMVAAEHFATIADAYVVTGRLRPCPDDLETADGRPLTLSNSQNRLAHMICCDLTELSPKQIVDIAEQIVAEQFRQLKNAIYRVVETLNGLTAAEHTPQNMNDFRIVLSGSAVPRVEEIVDSCPEFAALKRLSLSEMCGPDITVAACAFAVARLAQDRCADDLLISVPF